MKAEIQRRYDITVYPYEEDDEDHSSYHLEIKHIADRFVAMHITAPGIYNTYMYLANLNAMFMKCVDVTDLHQS